MTKQDASLNLPRKELIGSVQKGVFALLLALVVGAVGLYKFVDLEFGERAEKQAGLATLMIHTNTAERYWFEWLLSDQRAGVNVSFSEVKESELLPMKLLEVYTHIDLLLSRYQQVNANARFLDVKPELSFLKKITDQHQASRVAKSRRLFVQEKEKIRRFIARAEEQGREFAEQKLALNARNKTLFDYGEWGLLVVFGGIALLLVILSTTLVKRLGKGFQHLHVVLEKHKQGSFASDQNYNVIDEFTDLGRLFENELSARELELSESILDQKLMTLGMSHLTSAFLIADKKGDVKWLSKGFSDLWEQNVSVFEPLFDIDPGIDGPLGERLPDNILSGDHDIKLSLLEGRYSVVVERLTDQESDAISFLVSLTPLSQLAEIEVLRKSLELMVQGTWHYPIRVLRSDSPFQDFSLLLEEIRRSVIDLINAAEHSALQSSLDFKVTKLQQIKTLLTAKINDNCEHLKSIVPVNNVLSESLVSELGNVSSLSHQIDDTILVGYELLLQRLILVEKDVAGQVLLLNDVDRCLNEVRAGVLASLSATEDSSEQIRQRFSIDLEHDISSVQQQIFAMQEGGSLTLSLLESDHSIGAARLERAKQSVNEIQDRIDNLLLEVTRLDDSGNKEIIALIENTDGLDES